MMRNLKALALGVAGAVMLSGCATKGYVNRNVTAERNERIAADSAMGRDVAALRTDVNALRNDLNTLRTEFGARITAMEEGVKFAFPVHFAYDDATVREQDRAALDRFAQVVNKYYNGAQITVEGFADPAGSTRYNMGLSKRRADSVREYLVSQGMSDAALRSIGYGESRQVRPGAAGTTEGAELNRRVVFVVETPANTAAVTASALPSAP
jgi:peptidoglycan-associated lipoprotein